jgi:site-specific DNA-methyltransferase (cytosine-N4-specific)
MSSKIERGSSDVMPVTADGLASYGFREDAIPSSEHSKRRSRGRRRHPVELLDQDPTYSTPLGAAYVGDAASLLRGLPNHSINAIITSPPYALKAKKKYGNPNQDAYVDWFLGFAKEFKRVLRPTGSLVLEIGGAWNPGQPTRSIYHFELLVRLVREHGFHLAEEFFWFNRTRIPGPAEWVNVQRIRVKDAVTPIWWLSPSPRPAASNRRVLRPYSADMLRLFKVGYNHGKRPSGHVANKFEKNNRGAIPPNLIEVAHTSSKDQYQEYCRLHRLVAHPARFPRQVPDFFIKFLTRKGDLILDPFCGSNTTGAVAEKLERRWIGFDLKVDYIEGSIGRFDAGEVVTPSMVRGPRALTR